MAYNLSDTLACTGNPIRCPPPQVDLRGTTADDPRTTEVELIRPGINDRRGQVTKDDMGVRSIIEMPPLNSGQPMHAWGHTTTFAKRLVFGMQRLSQ